MAGGAEESRSGNGKPAEEATAARRLDGRTILYAEWSLRFECESPKTEMSGVQRVSLHSTVDGYGWNKINYTDKCRKQIYLIPEPGNVVVLFQTEYKPSELICH